MLQEEGVSRKGKDGYIERGDVWWSKVSEEVGR